MNLKTIAKIRSTINEPWLRSKIFKNKKSFYQIITSLDVFEDTELAIQHYLENNSIGDDGVNYLTVYGVLQSLFLQQDAIEHLSKALDLKYQNNPKLQNIRNIRNDSIGHPTNRKNKYFISISRPTLSTKGFEYIIRTPDKPSKFVSVYLPDLITEQRVTVDKILNNLQDYLSNKKELYKESYKMSKLSDLFHAHIPYFFEKIVEGFTHSHEKKFGAVHVKMIREIFVKFKNELDSKGLKGAYIGVNEACDEIEYVLSEIEKYFSDHESNFLDSKSGYIFVDYLQRKFDSLNEMAISIDQEYES